MRFGIFNARSLYRAESLSTVARELAMFKLDLVCIQQLNTVTGDYTFFYGKGNENHQLGKGFFVHTRKLSSVTRV